MADTSTVLIDPYLEHLWDRRGTDVLFTAGAPPLFRVDGAFGPAQDWGTLSSEDVERIVLSVLPPELPRAGDSADRREVRPGPSRADPGDRCHRYGQIDDPSVDHRPDKPQPGVSHRDGRGSDRVRPPAQPGGGEPAGGWSGRDLVPEGLAIGP